MRHPAARLLSLFALTALAACGGQASSELVGEVGPRARLSAPLYAPPGEAVTFDASASFDPDGVVIDYTFSFSDGSRQVTLPGPTLAHTFSQPGAYEVAVVVRDDSGMLSRATQLVVVRTDPDRCAESSDCSLGAECREALCYATGAGPGPGTADCISDSDCRGFNACRAGLCLPAGEPLAP